MGGAPRLTRAEPVTPARASRPPPSPPHPHPNPVAHASSQGGDDAFAREHLHATIHPGETVHVATMAGETWVAKEEQSGRLLQTIMTTDAAAQDVVLAVPQGFAMRAPLARFARGVGASSRN